MTASKVLTGDDRVAVSLDLRNLVQGYRSLVVVKNMSITLTPGGVTLLGLNGAGKSTLIKTLAGEMPPRSGEVRLLPGGDTLSVQDQRRAVGYLPQGTLLPSRMQAYDVVAYAGWLKGLSHKYLRISASKALEEVGLADCANIPISKLSGGMRQRVAIASVLVHDPAILLLDEPTVGLDPEQRLVVRRLIASLSAGRCVLVSTHQLADVDQLGRRVLVMHEGTIVFDGSPTELAERGGDESLGDTALEQGFGEVIRAVSLDLVKDGPDSLDTAS